MALDMALGLGDDVGRGCDSVLSHVSVSPRVNRKTSSQLGSQLSISSNKTPRKRSNASPGLATKRAELLQTKPIVPNKNVGSKLKAMLSENQENEKQKTPRVRKPSRWDAVMNKIEEGKQNERPRPRSKDVRSRLYTGLSSSRAASPALESRETSDRHPLKDLSRCGSANSDPTQQSASRFVVKFH